MLAMKRAREGNFLESARLYESAAALYESIGLTREAARARARSYVQRAAAVDSAFEKADFLERASSEFRKGREPRPIIQAHAYYFRGLSMMKIKPKAAVDYLQRAYEIYEREGIEERRKKVKEKLQKLNQNKGDVKTDFIDETIPKSFNNVKIESMSSNSTEQNIIQKSKRSYGSYNLISEKIKKQKGNKAEQCVYNYLVNKYGKENVIWVSRESDSEHYDIKYKKENEWIYVEVKTFSNNVFFMSKAEKDFADEKKDKYELFLVEISSNNRCEEGKIYPLKYSDLEKLEFIPKEFEIHYKIIEIKDK